MEMNNAGLFFQHDACITWKLGNGSVILQNVVVFENECTAPKIEFWTRFIDLYYQGTLIRSSPASNLWPKF